MDLRVPSDSLKSVQQLCEQKDAYGKRDNTLFLEAMREVLLWHQENNPTYRKFLEQKNFNPKDLIDIEKIPYYFANYFKRNELVTAKKEDISLHLTSSGTSGQKSQIFFDDWSIGCAQRMIDFIFEDNSWYDTKKVNYLLYSYEPEEGSKLGTAYTDNFLCKYAPINRVEYALKYSGKSGHKFDLFGCIKALEEFAKEGLPVRIFGFPSFFYFTLDKMRELGIGPLKLHPDSFVFLGGGWKGHQEKAIDKRDFYKFANEMLAIPDDRLRDGFGSVEHCIPYIECSKHNFHIPRWSDVIIRDVTTLENIGYDQIGYLNFVSPYITSVPANSVLMGDLAVKKNAKDCECELSCDYFEIIGRAQTSKSKSCAVSASELIKEMD